MIKEAYTSKEVSILLKEKGFNESVHHEYHDTFLTPHFHKKSHNFNGYEYANCGTVWFSAPTHQMAMRWLREEKNIFIVIEPHAYDYINEKNKSYSCSLWVGDNYYEYLESKDYPSYEEAVEAALKYALTNLI